MTVHTISQLTGCDNNLVLITSMIGQPVNVGPDATGAVFDPRPVSFLISASATKPIPTMIRMLTPFGTLTEMMLSFTARSRIKGQGYCPIFDAISGCEMIRKRF